MNKDITSLRSHLFDALNRLAEASCEDELNREILKSSSIVHVADAIIRTAEVENQFVALTNGTGSGFIPLLNDEQPKRLIHELVPKQEELFNSDEKDNWIMPTGDKNEEK